MNKYLILINKEKAIKEIKEEVLCNIVTEDKKEQKIKENIKELKRILSIIQDSKELLRPLKKEGIKNFLICWGISIVSLAFISSILEFLPRIIFMFTIGVGMAIVCGKLYYKEYLKYTQGIRKILDNYCLEDTEKELAKMQRLLEKTDINKTLMQSKLESLNEELIAIAEEINTIASNMLILDEAENKPKDELEEETVLNESNSLNRARKQVRE